MGYPMTYRRVVDRNLLTGDYDLYRADPLRSLISGDLRRLEKDAQDDAHVARHVEATGATPEQVRHILKRFFGGLE